MPLDKNNFRLLRQKVTGTALKLAFAIRLISIFQKRGKAE
jgi:hypothetical protein